MKKWVFLLVFTIGSSFCSWAQNQKVNGELIVQLNNGELNYFITEFNATHQFDFKLKEPLSQSLGIYLLTYELEIPDATLLTLVREFGTVSHVQFNHKGITSRKTPNDPSFKAQWGLEAISAEKAWNITTGGFTENGDEIVVAVVDEDFLLTHDDLKHRYWKNEHEIPFNQIDDDSNGFVDDYDGWNVYSDTGYIYPGKSHGTGVAGVLAAHGNNLTDMTGINWNVKVLPIQRTLSAVIESHIIKAYNYVLEQRLRYNRTNGDSGAYIVACNSSFGIDNAKPQDYPIWCAMYDKMGQAGILNVGAGPNASVNVDVQGDIPCSCPSKYLITVNSIDRDLKHFKSGYGKTTMDIAAPGLDIISTNRSNTVHLMTGTSFAAPSVSGAVALMYSAVRKDTLNLFLNEDSLLALRIRNDLLDSGWDANITLDGKSTTGGVLNLYKAVLAARDTTDKSISVIEFGAGQSAYKVYPNPTTSVINVELKQQQSNVGYQISIYDLSGVLVKQVEWSKNDSYTNTIDLQNLTDGLYMLNILSADGSSESFKLVKR